MWDFSNFVSFSYYFDKNPGGDFLPGYVLLAFFIFLLFLPGLLKKKAEGNKYLKKSLKKRLWHFPILAVLGIILVSCRFAQVPGFSMRVWFILVLILSVVTAGYSMVKIYGDYRKRLDSVEREKKK